MSELISLNARGGHRKQASRARPDRAGSFPTASGGIARAAHARALSLGIDVTALLKSAGLTDTQIRTPEMRISARKQITFLNEVSAALHDDLLGIHLAQVIDLRELGLVYYVLASCDNLGTALSRLARYSGVHNEGVHITVNQTKHIAITFEYVGIPRASDRHQIECFVAILVRLCRQLSGQHLIPQRVLLAHRRPRTPVNLRTLFGCKIDFGSEVDEVVFPLELRTTLMVHADPYLNSLLERYCEETIKSRRSKAGDWTSRVENTVAPLLPHGEATIERVAQRLGLSVRTLTRRLQQEGRSFAKVVQDLRLRLATQYLSEPGMRVMQVAWLLGYRDPGAFSHAYKRWTGRPPRNSRLQTK
jgi:AraC-like DNA-binding protein